MEFFIQTLIDASSLGSLYALLALGLALVFGIMNLVNFAHGDLITIGGYTMVFLAAVPMLGVIAAAIMVVIILALGMERVAFRPVRKANPTTLLVTSFGVSFLIQNLVILIIGALPKPVGLISIDLLVPISILGMEVSKFSLITLAVTIFLLIALVMLLQKTALGIQMRAAAEDFTTAKLMGIKADRVIAAAFGLCGFLAGVVSVLWIGQMGTVAPLMGVEPTVMAFTAIVIGGMGSLSRAALGGFLVGFITIALQASLPLDIRVYRQAILFGIVIIFLLTRPGGLMPLKTTGRKV
ncbi:MAG: branched-chain amino acid ABC transporter permease [Pseudomonadota bacterium]